MSGDGFRDVHDHLVRGMNFEHMPELGWTFGYPLVLAVTLLTCTLLHRRLKRGGWL